MFQLPSNIAGTVLNSLEAGWTKTAVSEVLKLQAIFRNLSERQLKDLDSIGSSLAV